MKKTTNLSFVISTFKTHVSSRSLVLRFIGDRFLFFLSALDCGADMFELDVQLTADGQVGFIKDLIFYKLLNFRI